MLILMFFFSFVFLCKILWVIFSLTFIFFFLGATLTVEKELREHLVFLKSFSVLFNFFLISGSESFFEFLPVTF